MTQARMTEMLSQTICVSPEAAQAALEARDWNVPEAARLLQREQSRARVAAKAVRRDSGWKLFFDRLTGRGDAAVLSGLAHE